MSATTVHPPLVPRRTAAALGVLSVAAALGAGHLVAGLVSPVSSPFLAVGNSAIALAPQWLVDVAKSAFGTADKPVLLAGMALVLVGAAVGVGLLSRGRPQPGVRALVGLGLLGFAAVALSPAFTPVDLLAPAAAAGAGVLALRRLHALALPGTPRAGSGVDRRTMLVGTSALVGFGALAAGGLGQLLGSRLAGSREEVTARLARVALAERAPAIPAGAAFPELGTPTFLTPNADFYRIDTALRIPTQTAADWSLRVHGMVDRELTLTFDDLLARPLRERTVTMICVSNEVGDDYISTADFVGVDLREVLLEAGVAPGADQVLSTSSDGLWTAGTPLEVLLEPDRGALLAVGMNGEALPPEHGFPVRMVVPGLYGYVSATKWVTDLEVTTFDRKQAYWLQRGWGRLGPVKTQSRIDVPRSAGSAPAGAVTVAGIAWSQPVGISRVEVRLDDGPWADAELATEVGGDTWRMWRAVVDAAPGSHVVTVRATDANGVTQTEERAPVLPDGATGHHSVVFTAL
ncbi:molybdopterin-dependent oxidoreductase [Pseudonocardia hydrocarbonoxydans]|uniref:Molybdopterin-binding protein n=1 Tax=Pseudonocardia hydrocarbonoxydans TaxID=76726 RepID=A0A4Y3WKW5_9PSEU|nr:molybdopterin-dependent oxidoreductase [Pseudonocardia hydrocarbonoxydans]GEC18881.1 molybdopterin-binding protein [Pseudonocardia hydrocarbonoxydans]